MEKISHDVPLHMDKWERNERIYPTLLSMGLFIEPHYENEERRRIEYFIVSAGIPNAEVAGE